MNSVKLPDRFDPSKYNIDDKEMSQNINTKTATTCSNISTSKLLYTFNNFENLNFSNTEHRNELIKIFPEWLLIYAHDADKKLFLAMSRFDNINKTFVAGCFTFNSFKLISYKRKTAPWAPGKKWITKKGTSPNSTLFHRIYTDVLPIYFVEGHKDALTAILLGLDVVMIPTAGYINCNITNITKEIQDRNIVFIVEDKQSYGCMMRLAKLLQSSAKHIELKQFSKNEKMDLSDYIQKFNSIEEVTHELQN